MQVHPQITTNSVFYTSSVIVLTPFNLGKMELLSYRGTQIDLSKINQPQIFTNSPCSACRVVKVADKKVWG